jgi:glycosyltransferase involved in cell wall biosynthesis
LDSIGSQSVEAWECIIVDDGSSDQTAEVAMGKCSSDSRFKLVRQSCGGPSRARNRGFLESHPGTRFVSFMDADDVWEPRALELLMGELVSKPDSVGAHGLAELIDEDGRPLAPGNFSAFGRRRLGLRAGSIVEWPLSEPTVFQTLAWTGPLHPPGLLLARRESYELAGLYDPGLHLCEDWDMCLRLSRLGPIEFVDRVLLWYRRHGGNLSNNARENRKIVRRLHAKTYFSKSNSAEQRLQLRQGWRAWQLFKIREKWRAANSGCAGLAGPGARVRALLEITAHALRYLRGYPGAEGV